MFYSESELLTLIYIVNNVTTLGSPKRLYSTSRSVVLPPEQLYFWETPEKWKSSLQKVNMNPSWQVREVDTLSGRIFVLFIALQDLTIVHRTYQHYQGTGCWATLTDSETELLQLYTWSKTTQSIWARECCVRNKWEKRENNKLSKIQVRKANWRQCTRVKSNEKLSNLCCLRISAATVVYFQTVNIHYCEAVILLNYQSKYYCFTLL